MIKTLFRAIVLAAVGAVAFAGPAFAGGSFDSYRYAFRCEEEHGGQYGFGYISSRGYVEEIGTTGANYFKMIFKWQQKNVDNPNGWVPAYVNAQKTFQSTSFPNNSTSYFFDKGRKFSFQGAFDFEDYWNRIVITFQVWDDRPGSDVLLYRHTVRTPAYAC